MNEEYETIMQWREKDWLKLNKVVKRFNNTITRLQKEGYKNLPQKESYEELIGLTEISQDEMTREIMTRREFNLKIESLNRFNRKTAELTTLPSGEEITSWQKDEISRMKRRATIHLENEIIDLYNKGKSKDWIKAREKTLELLDNVYDLKGSDLQKKLKVLENNARGDRELRYAKQWQENYISALKEMGEYEGQEELLEKLKSFKNPLEMYDYIKQSPMLDDLFLYYKDNADIQTFAGFDTNQEAFNRGLQDLGL